MSTQAPTHFVKGFQQGITHVAQQKESRFRMHVRTETLVEGEENFFDWVGSVTASRRTTRHGDTPLTDTPQTRRKLVSYTYEHADLIDRPDMLRTLNDPTNAFTVAFGRAFGRATDDEIIGAADGTAYSGKTGTTEQTLPAAQYVADGGVGMTVAKIVQANKILRANEHDPDAGFKFAASQEQYEDMLQIAEITSSDYATIRALMAGEISTYMGFDWIQSERLGVDSNSDRKCLAWARDAICYGELEAYRARISERDDKSYSTQVYARQDMGASRMEETGVVVVECNE